jgi:hypothetical protein
LGGGWLVAHNLISLGRINSYSTSTRPSELSAPQVTHAALRQMATDLVASQRFGQVVESENGWPAFLLAAGLIGISICLVLRGSRWSASTIRRTMARRRLEMLLALFSLCHLSMVIVARSVYGWGELVSGRHFVPIYWILILLSLMLMWVAADRFRWRRIVRSAVVIATLIAAGLQVRRAVLETIDARRPSKLSPAAIELLAAQVGRDQIVLSDAAGALRVFGNLNARHPGRVHMKEPEVTLEEMTAAARSGLLWGVVAVNEDRIRSGLYGHALKSLVVEAEHHPEWKESSLPGSDVKVLQMMGKR